VPSVAAQPEFRACQPKSSVNRNLTPDSVLRYPAAERNKKSEIRDFLHRDRRRRCRQGEADEPTDEPGFGPVLHLPRPARNSFRASSAVNALAT